MAISKSEYSERLRGCWLVAHLIAGLPLEEMIALADKADVIGSVVDPTLYIRNSQALAQDLTLMRALRSVQLTVQGFAATQRKAVDAHNAELATQTKRRED